MDPRTSAQDVMRCDLCETAAVQMHCDTCLVNLCKGCVGEHISTEESKDHKVVKFQSRKSTPLYPECASHEKEKCEMYCRHCDIPVCQTCLASDQHLGHKLSKILHVLGEKKDLIRNEQSELNETIYPTYQDIAVDVQNRMSQLEKEYGDLSTAITKHGENWHREIENLVRKLKTQVDEMKNSQLQTLQKHLNEINKNIVAIKAEIDLLDIAADSNDISSPLNVRSNVDQYKNLPQKLVLSVPKFTPGTIQGEQLCKLFGTLSSISLTADDQGYSIKTTQRSPKDESSFVDQTSPEIGCRQRQYHDTLQFQSGFTTQTNHNKVRKQAFRHSSDKK
ncbi:E3 ubiquitin-protein ligase TRIM45-like [Saccostrea echinata]|uniref:E3 ubiquitin-protein ligase TRIM45-like n=1 Tax=Saccostrea echinata TaxID=191078 RepID=UPI002A83AA88|nr:E3 ubiquitin-protein ligase TRIM45-like [Saccostrea echinata]